MNFPGGWELILIVVVGLLLFGSKKLPESARSLGRSMRIFKSEIKGMKDDDGDGLDDATDKPMPEKASAEAVKTPSDDSATSG